MCNDRITALEVTGRAGKCLTVPVYFPASEYEDDEVEEMYGLIEEIHEKDGKDATNSIIMRDRNSVVGDESHIETFLDHVGSEGEIRELR